MEQLVHPADHFGVWHPRMEMTFQFGCSNDRDTVGITVRSQGLAAYEAPVTDILIELIRTAPGLVLDIGANTGLYTLAAAATDRSVEVIAFEPLEPVRDLLRHNIELNPELVPRITIEPVGLSSETGSFSFYEADNDRGYISTSSSLEQLHVQMVGDEIVQRVIRTVTLDDFAQSLGDRIVSFMKIDVEGHEHAVIGGGRQFLAKHRPIFTIELLGDAESDSINALLSETAYLAFAMAPGVLRQCQSMMFFPDAWNHLLVPGEKLDRIFALCRKLGLRLEVI